MNRPAALLLAGIVLLGLGCGEVWADGGTLRLARDAGPYRIAVFSDPAPLRAGPADIGVWLSDRQTDELATDVELLVTARHLESGRRLTAVASRKSATNKLLQAAKFELPLAGEWEFRVSAPDRLDPATGRPCEAAFTAVAADRRPRWREMAWWIGWPIVPIAWFAVRVGGRRDR